MPGKAAKRRKSQLAASAISVIATTVDAIIIGQPRRNDVLRGPRLQNNGRRLAAEGRLQEAQPGRRVRQRAP